jgi:hypothetical protein
LKGSRNNTPIARDTVKTLEKTSIDANRSYLETELDNKTSKIIEMAEDAFGDEVYCNFMKANRAHVEERGFDDLHE